MIRWSVHRELMNYWRILEMNNMNAKYEISQVTNLADSMLVDCYHIAALSHPNEAEEISYTLPHNVNNRGHIMFVVTENSYVRGFISGHLVSTHDYAGEAKIDWLFVDSGHRRRGVGGILMRAYIDACRARGVSQLMVQRVRTLTAKQFYEKHGFVSRGVVNMMRDVIKVR